MAVRFDYAVGTDDVGTVSAADIEASPLLQLLAEDPPADPDARAVALLGLEPAQALALCESSDLYEEICDNVGFKDQYRFEWHVSVHLALGGDRMDVSLFRTRVVGDIKEIYERNTRLARTEYTFFKRMNLDLVYYQRLQTVVPTAQSSLGGVATPSFFDDTRLSVRFDVVQDAQTVVPLRDRTLTHWFANGETIELSE